MVKYCPNCGEKNEEGVKFCGDCGSPMNPKSAGIAKPKQTNFEDILEGLEYPLPTLLSLGGILVGFLIPIIYLFTLLPEIYLYTRPESHIKRRGTFLIAVTIVLFVAMSILYAMLTPRYTIWYYWYYY